MPWYDFQCEDCEHVFEEQLSINDDRSGLICPQCGGKDIQRVFLTVAACVGKNNNSSSSSCSTESSTGG
ncbi:zinc ribbon domain-containing protein [bacterium]|nr:zinc ribbon domain-containing protein [bacterium]